MMSNYLPRIVTLLLLLLLLPPGGVCKKAAVSSTSVASKTKLVIGVDGGTESIRACCFDAMTGQVVGEACAVPYKTYHPEPGWAEQNPEDWYENLVQAVRGAITSLAKSDKTAMNNFDISAICVDTTCCSVVALGADHKPLRRSLLWMDQRSAPQTIEVFEKCKGDPALAVNCGGEGPLSAEWMTPKALWIAQNEASIWEQASVICEYQDYINLRLTGKLVASSCNAAARWHWDGVECIVDATEDCPYPGRPLSLYEKLGIPELAAKLPKRCLAMGDVVGDLTDEAARSFGLDATIPVVQGGPDAFVGMIGLGCIQPGQLCLITGSSHLHCAVTAKPTSSVGTWGAYRGAPLSNINFAEGGQSSTGSIMRWAKNLFGNDLDYSHLDDEAAEIPPGSEGLVALETFQGSRTPKTDPLLKGALVGLTLAHSRGHIWRALLEAICFGTRACIEGLAAAGHGCDEIVIAGGATRSPLWLQLHADITGIPVVVCENKDAPLLGCAILASVGVGLHPSVSAAVQSMVRRSQLVNPDPPRAATYSEIYESIYSKVGDAVYPLCHSMHDVRRKQGKHAASVANSLRGGKSAADSIEVSPSLLASDWSNIGSEVSRCKKAGACRLHVDVFDGVFIDSPHALTFGPQMVASIRKVGGKGIHIDCHVCVERPLRYVQPLSDAGTNCFIFQLEATKTIEEATALAQSIKDAGMIAGVSINPETGVENLYPLIETGLIDVVDILAVNAGFGGQVLQRHALQKMNSVVEWKREHKHSFLVMVDGGVNLSTASEVIASGAQILVAGTFLFQHPSGIEAGVHQLKEKSR